MKHRRQTSTDLNELVETHNLALSLERLRGAPYNDARWRRALYHALLISFCADREEASKIREALKLP